MNEVAITMDWVYFAMTFAIGGLVYRFRGRYRFLYGMGQILVAIMLVYLAFFPHGPNVLLVSAPSLWDILTTNTANVVLGIYTFMRGWDNIAIALRDM
jgi:hypothetical protein